MKSLYSGIAALAITASTAFAQPSNPILQAHLKEQCRGVYTITLPYKTGYMPTGETNNHLLARFMSGETIVDQNGNPLVVTISGVYVKKEFNEVKRQA